MAPTACWDAVFISAAVAAYQPVGMLSRPSHAPLAILQELVQAVLGGNGRSPTVNQV
ncbi:MAG: hypothetical protein IPJ94_31355 [Chloroflexi bacterium]|nr:hypothetical protein [Chloroflexota bacterium]